MDTQNGADPGGGKYFFASSFPPGYYYGVQSKQFGERAIKSLSDRASDQAGE